MAKKLTVIEQKKMLAERLTRSGSGKKCPTVAIGGDGCPHLKKRAPGIVIREPQHVVRTPYPAEQGHAHWVDQDAPCHVDYLNRPRLRHPEYASSRTKHPGGSAGDVLNRPRHLPEDRGVWGEFS